MLFTQSPEVVTIDLPEVEEINPLATDGLTGMVGKSVSDHSG